jgi:alpha-glucosidase
MRVMFTAIFVATPLLILSASAQWQSAGLVDSLRHDSPTSVLLFAGNSVTRIEFVGRDIARVRFVGGKRLPSVDASWAVTGTFTVPTVFKEKTDSTMTLRTDLLSLQVGLRPLRIRFADGHGRILNQDSPKGMCWSGNQVRVWKNMPWDERYIGFGEKAGKFQRRGTDMTMWNSDIPAYTADTDPLYQTIPFFYGFNGGSAYGIFFDNPYRSTFDMGKETRDEYSFGAEDGELNYYFFAGPDPRLVLQEYTQLVGRMPLPPRWSLGYQQCRWSYTPEARVREIGATFRSLQIPCDVIYLDIDYMQGYRVFTWNATAFPQPRALIKDLAAQGFKTVVIIDPGIKADSAYAAFRSGLSGDSFVRNNDGSLFLGDVWPGTCAFPDFSNAATRSWWGNQFAGLIADGVQGWWNDMNEPSVFNSQTKTIPLAALHRPDIGRPEHAALHNVYGMQMTRGTYEGVLTSRPDRRPFVLTRASYAGGQRYAAAWTGDNVSSWEHLRMALAMCLNLSVSGQPFVGSDIGGFTGKPSGELFARWLQLGVFTPLMRAHSEINSPNKEPWEFGGRFTDINRRTIGLRYRLLPYIYSVMEQASRTGIPAMRPVAFAFPGASGGGWTEEEFMFGDDVLVAPALSEGIEIVTAYLPPGEWYHYWTSERFRGDTTITVSAPIDRLPFFVRAGSSLPTQQPVQFSDQSPIDPLTFTAYPPSAGKSGRSEYYEDDGISFRYRSGEYLRRTITVGTGEGSVTLVLSACEGSYIPPDRVLVLRVAGQQKPREVRLNGGIAREQTGVTSPREGACWRFDAESGGLSIVMKDTRNPVTAIIRY